jgi:MFS family permease
LAGLLVTVWGFGWAFLVDGISYLAVLAGLWFMRTDELRPAPVTPRAKGQVREGFRYVRSVPDLWLPMVMMGIVGMLAFNFQTTFPLFAIRDLGGTDVTFTLIMSVLSVGSFIGAIASARRHAISVRSVGMAALGFGASLVVMAMAPGLAAAFPLGLLVGFASITFLTASTAIVQIKADPMMRGRVLALQSILFLGSTPIGGPIVGAIAEHWGARWSIALGGIATILAGAWGIVASRRQAPTSLDRAARVESEVEALVELDHDLVRDGHARMGGPVVSASGAPRVP